MSQKTAAQQATSLVQSSNQLVNHFGSDPGLIGLGVTLAAAAILIPLTLWLNRGKGNSKTGTLARARFATAAEIERSNKKSAAAVSTLVNGGPHNRVALWIGQPEKLTVDHEQKKIFVPYDPKTIFLRSLEQMLLVLGSIGSGKSFSVLDPLKRSAILMGLPLIDFDFKGYEEYNPHDPREKNLTNETGSLAPSSKIAGFALEHGYKVYTIAPGSPDSDRINLLSFLDSPTDADNAYQAAACTNENIRESGDVPPDFFSQSTEQLVQAIFQYAKGLEYGADLATCHKILALPNLIKRLQNADLPQYVKVAFDQFLASCDSPETAASIATTASLIFSRFMTPALSAVFCGETTIPLDLTGRVMITFRVNPRIQKSAMPLIATALYMLITRNIYQPRTQPICFFLDEFVRFKLLDLGTLLNVARSNGGCFFLGTQSIPGIEERYGKDGAKNILGGTKNKFAGQLEDLETAEYFTKLLGEEDVEHEQKSKGSGKGGRSTNRSDQLSKRPLVEVSDWGRLTEGEFYILSPGVQSKSYRQKRGRPGAVVEDEKIDGRLPYYKKIVIPDAEMKAAAVGERRWRKYRAKVIAEGRSKPLTDADLKAREEMVADLLPLPSVDVAPLFAPLTQSDLSLF